MVQDILASLPNEFDLEIVHEKYSLSNADSLNLILQQEVRRYNQLLNCIRTHSLHVQDAIQGSFFPSSCDFIRCFYFETNH